MITTGTRFRQNALHIAPDQGKQTQTLTRDLGGPYVSASITFVNSTTKQAQAANGTFSNAEFFVGMVVLIEGTNLNNGYRTITAIDTTNQSYLTLSPSPSNEGPLTCIIRSA